MTRWEWLVPGAIAAVLVVACILISPKKPMWFDEVLTWIVATDPSLRHMLHNIAASADLPLMYYLVAQLWRQIFGSSVLALRLLSAVAFSGAVFLSWAALRPSFPFSAVAYAHVAVFTTSTVLLYEDVELRSYGVFLLVVGLALLLFVRLAINIRPSALLLVATAICHAALVLCHIYGLAYSAALLVALVASDLASRKARFYVYSAIIAGWLAFVPSLRPLFHLASLGHAHGWSNVPKLLDLLPTLGWPDLPFVIGATCLGLLISAVHRPNLMSGRMRFALAATAAVAAGAAVATRSDTGWNVATLVLLIILFTLAWAQPSASRPGAKPLLYASLALFAVPVAFFLGARSLPPLFVPRYFLPSIFAPVILLAVFFDNVTDWIAAGTPVQKLAFVAALVSLLMAPVYGAVKLPARDVPPNGVSAATLEGLAPAALPVAVEDPFAFLPLYFHACGGTRTYVYILDQEAAEASRFRSAVINFDLLRRLSAYGYLEHHVFTRQEFLAENPAFLVLHKPGFAWFDLTLARNPAYNWRELGEVNGSELILVRRTNDPLQPSSRIGGIK
jgi:hypothetical protein